MIQLPTLFLRSLFCVALLLPQFIASALTCKNTPIVTLNGDGELEIAADFFVLNTNTCCNFGISYELSLDNGATYQPSATFTCNNLGQVEVLVKLTDCLGLPNHCQTAVIVQENMGICDTGCGGCCLPNIAIKPLILSLHDDYSIVLHASWFDDGSFSECVTGPLQFSFSQNPADSLKTLACDELGLQPIQIWATDSANSQTSGDTYVIVQLAFGDCSGTGPCLPALILLNGMILDMKPDGRVCATAREFDVASHVSNCSSATSYTLSFSDNPNDTLACFDCDDLPQQSVSIYIHDNLGNINYIESFVLIQDVSNYCGSTASLVPTNDEVCNAHSIDYLLNAGCTEYFFNIGATAGLTEVTPPIGACGDQSTWCDSVAVAEKSVWFKFNVPTTQQIEITTTGMNTQLALWAAASCEDVNTGFATLIAANDDDPAVANGGSKLVAECLEVGKDYYLQMDGYSFSEGGFGMSFSATGLPCTSAAPEKKLSNADFSIAPNPSSGHVNILAKYQSNWLGGQVVVTDISGRVVLTKKIDNGGTRINVENIVPGIYFIHLRTGDLISPFQKLVIAR